jgi:hypothetical protein
MAVKDEAKGMIAKRVPNSVKTYIVLMTKVCQIHGCHLTRDHLEKEHGMKMDN